MGRSGQGSSGNQRMMARQFALEVYRQSVAEKRAAQESKGDKSVKLPAILKHTEGTATGKNLRAYTEPRKCLDKLATRIPLASFELPKTRLLEKTIPAFGKVSPKHFCELECLQSTPSFTLSSPISFSTSTSSLSFEPRRWLR